MKIEVLILLLVYFNNCNAAAPVVRGNGTFYLNGIFPITQVNNNKENEKEINYQMGVMMADAMRFAVQKVNQMDYLYGYKLGIKNIFDSTTVVKVRNNILNTFLTPTTFIVGPYSSETSYISSILTDTFHQIAISYSATYSDFKLFGVRQKSMFRTVPCDLFRVQASIDFLKEIKWTYIGVISSFSYDGERDSINFVSKLHGIGVCLSSKINLPKIPNEQVYKDAIIQMDNDKRLKSIVLFTANRDSKYIFSTLKKMKLRNRFLILCVYGCTNYVKVVKGHEDIANGTLSLYLHNTQSKEFKSFFTGQNPIDHPESYFQKFWENVFECSLNKTNMRNYKKICNGKEKLSDGKGYYPQTPVHTVLDSVYQIAKSLKRFIRRYCSKDALRNQNSSRPFCKINPSFVHLNTPYVLRELVKMSYSDGTLKIKEHGVLEAGDLSTAVNKVRSKVRYDVSQYSYKTGGYKNTLAWKWELLRTSDPVRDLSKLPNLETKWYLSHKYTIMAKATCSSKCRMGYYRKYDQNFLKSKCCWECQKCPENSAVKNNTCVKCAQTEMVGPFKKTCLPLPERGMQLTEDITSVVLALFSVLGLCATLAVATVFTMCINNIIVKASGRDLCFVILLGITLTFVCPFFYFTEVSKATCVVRGTLPGFAFLACYMSIFLKTNRIYRIFLSARVSLSRPSLTSSSSQVIALCSGWIIQTLILAVWFSSNMPTPEIYLSSNKKYITVHCSSDSNPILLVLNLSLSIPFIIACTVLAYKTRHFPKYYNEAKYIGITLYVTCIAWALFLPTFLFAARMKIDFLGEYLLCVICILIGYVTLFGMFYPKIAMIFKSSQSDVSHDNLKSRQGLNDTQETVDLAMDTFI